MKKRILSLFMSFILSFSVFSGRIAVHAIDGLPDITIYGPTLLGGGIVTWDPVPGAAYYFIDGMDEWPGDYFTECKFEPEAVLSYWSCRVGSYNTVITAYNSNGQPIAKGISGVYPYYPLGTMATPTNPRWSGPAAWWDKVTDAESYKINLYENGVKTQDLIISGQNYAPLAHYLLDYDTDYTFRVAARRIKYTISEVSKMSDVAKGRVKRISGASRYETGRRVAEEIRQLTTGGYSPLTGIVLANGDKFPDALGGAFLSWQRNAPILLINENTVNETLNFILNNVITKSNIYVLGGEGAVSDSWLKPLSYSYNIKRFSGADRYETNLSILKETGVPDKKILVCTGDNFADALSASGVNYPILLVNNNGLTDSQKAYLQTLYGVKAVILGGTGAVSSKVENELKKYVSIENRISGSSRYDTSLKIADYFFSSTLKRVVITTGLNFPDGLTGGLLAHAENAPLILANTNFEGNKKIYDFLASRSLFELGGIDGYALGGKAAVPVSSVYEIFNGYPYYE